MLKELRILMIEDSPVDAELILRILKRSGSAVTSRRVETRAEMQKALIEQKWDIVIADFSLPQFSGEEALEVLKESGLDLPFILVSGTVGEEIAVKMMRAGADDYLLKDKLERLYPAIEREVGEFLNRSERRKAEQELRRHEKQLSFLAEASGILGSSLDYQKTIKQALFAAIPRMCDFCIVKLNQANGSVEEIFAQSDQQKDEPFEETIQKAKSNLEVELNIRGGILGSVTWMMVESDRRFMDGDFWIIEEFARRIASAIDNARLYAEAQHAISVRDEFLMIASHELKTPITSLKMQLQMTRRGIHTDTGVVPKAPQLSKTIDTSLVQVDRLTKLIEDMLDASRMQSGKLNFDLEEVNLASLIREVLNRFAIELNTAKLQVEVDADPEIVGYWDKARIEQVFVNLTSNAIKYAPATKILITATQSHDRATLVFQDNGPGVPKEKQSLIFERFERGNFNRNIVGLGLGLYICKQIIDAHGGSIRVQSDEGKGTRFIIDLPLTVDAAHKNKGISFGKKTDLSH